MAAQNSHAPERGFDFTSAMRQLCADMVSRLPELRHVDLDRVALSFCQARKNVAHGLQATLTPLRFQHGATTERFDGERYGCQRVFDAEGHEYLYILSFYVPRFLNLRLEEKLATTLHELWHISPNCDGDLRRHEGRCYAHGSSQRHYDAEMDRLARKWLSLDPPYHLYQFLELDYRQLVAEYGAVYGQQVAVPKLLRLRPSLH
jgi:hypothetical protein